ncbi:hypothetical protein [Candidatus Nephthysia bennettiae]|uniref:Uncharacterized protein n=1 Tax=Candidatus Nephthysia bennettiae TaxID=3127016 RepID=A0A934N456_9BACT|nr:hypothetical protein [Candidatus Dormibacteraeota bacterium]MBJ7611234.1 hypothetical protein [Candidatus Dormibacteraeota bacterium]
MVGGSVRADLKEKMAALKDALFTATPQVGALAWPGPRERCRTMRK